MDGRLQPVGPCLHAHIPVDASGAQVRACTQDDRPAAVDAAGADLHPCDLLSALCFFRQEVDYLRLLDVQIFLLLQHPAHGPAVEDLSA